MNLSEVLTLVAAQVHCDAKELIDYAAEDDLGGYHIDEMQRKFPQGSAWAVELQTLYALIRHFKFENIAEIGGWLGASASHMALACKRNGVGHVTSVDNGVGGQPHGALIPKELQEYVTLVNEDGRVWLAAQPPQSIGLLFEDADHSTQLVMELTRLALIKIEAGGILATHDAAHDLAILGGGQIVGSSVGREVREGLSRAGAYATSYLAEPSDCGLAITVIPGTRKPKTVEMQGVQGIHEGYVQAPNPKLAQDQLAALSATDFMGNANIESVSEPPPIVTRMPDGRLVVENTDMRGVISHGYEVASKPTEEDTKETPVKTPRGKGKRKPKAE